MRASTWSPECQCMFQANPLILSLRLNTRSGSSLTASMMYRSESQLAVWHLTWTFLQVHQNWKHWPTHPRLPFSTTGRGLPKTTQCKAPSRILILSAAAWLKKFIQIVCLCKNWRTWNWFLSCLERQTSLQSSEWSRPSIRSMRQITSKWFIRLLLQDYLLPMMYK